MTAVALALLAGVAEGKVFWLWGGSGSSALLDYSRLGKTAYETTVQINGGRGHLTVVKATAGLRATLQRVRAACEHGARVDFSFADTGAGLAVVSGGQRTLKAVIIATAPEESLVMGLEQSESEAALSAMPPDRHMLDAVPAFPGSAPSSFLRNEDTGTALETSSCQAEAGSVADFFVSTLERDGWSPVFKGAASPPPATQVFLKGRDICCVSVQSTEDSRETRITVLHKRGAVE